MTVSARRERTPEPPRWEYRPQAWGSTPSSSSVDDTPRHVAGFTLLQHAVDEHDRLLEVGDRFLELDALLAQGFKPLAELRRGDTQLGELPILEVVEIKHLLDLLKREADLLAAQDELQAGSVAIAEQTGPTPARRRQQTLLLVETKRARRDAEFAAQLRDRVGSVSVGTFAG